ncbi:MFS transporter [Streptomyces sp. PTM05]|uniref:MFS transporter n=1 Tax=Streptantibioticus parmotrematis TaxID=2873249 RepID=A0ABS7QZ98_9ACTN|nr:MFS transporter [Streptantibioticus parmotrematis]MBY8888534.1 MFS transporter [Streptantibioticus parmotrematis]
MTGGRRRSLGRRFGWLWAAFAVSSYGSGLGFGAFPLIAVLVLHSGPAQVAALSAAGRAAGALLAVPLGPWVEFRRKRPVMIATDLARFATMASVPVAYALGCLGFVQLLVVSVVVAAANIASKAASGAYLKSLVPPEDLLIANGRFESTTWTSTVVGPPLGGAAIALFGPATTVIADAVSYLLSAVGIRAIGGSEERPAVPERAAGARARVGELLEGWRYVLASSALRPLFFNAMLSNGLIMATEPPLAVLLLGRLGFAPWQYGLAFAAPCVGGLIGSRMAHRLVTRFGQHKVMLWAGAGRAVWLVGLAFVRPGAAGMAVVIVCQLGLVTCCGVFNPVLATYRLARTAPDRVARTLSAWSVSTSAAIAATTALWGVLASATSPRTALALAGVLFLATPLLLPRRERASGTAEVAPAR